MIDKEYVKEDLLKTFKWLKHDSVFNVIEYRDCVVVNLVDLDVNFNEWHKGGLRGIPAFRFDGKSIIPLSVVNYGSFKRILKRYERSKCIKGEQ